MENIKDFILNYDYDSLQKDKLISETEIPLYEKEIGIKFGPQLREYILNYGYLGYEHIELEGINNIQKTNSDMVRSTKALHDLSNKTINLIVVENQGDGDYYLVDSNDNMYNFLLDDLSLENLNIDLFKYIKNRLQSV